LIKNTELALIVIRLSLTLIGAAAGFHKLSLKIEQPGWWIVLATSSACMFDAPVLRAGAIIPPQWATPTARSG